MDDKFTEIRGELGRLADCRPHEADLNALSRYKLPGKVLMAAGGLLWRAEELARNAFDALERQDFVTSAVLTRALMETTGGVVLIHNLVEKSIEKGLPAGFDKKINRLVLGSNVWDEMDDAIHVHDLLREVQKVIPGFFDEHYASLSEYAHPNWLGTFGAYGKTHEGEARISFAHEGRSPDNQLGTIIGRLSGAIGLSIGYYEMLESMRDDFVKVVEAFYDGREEPEDLE